MKIPDDAVIYILYQRTGYLALLNNRVVAKLVSIGPNIFYRTIINLGGRFQKKGIKRAFSNEMESEYQSIKPWLPEKVETILDIGCGVGGINVLLYRHYQFDHNIKFFMLDKTRLNPKMYYGFKSAGAFYNSLGITQNLLEENEIPRMNIQLIEATPDFQIPFAFQADLVISLISWGFHYPVSTYLQPVYDHMASGAHLILDIRKGTDGESELRQLFTDINPISESKTKTRVLIKKS
jgi:hypothetical protein